MTEEYRAYLAQRGDRPPVWADSHLAHYGVKGQKWGVRNYQYYDGGYTPAGAERYWGGTGQGRRAANNTASSSAARARSEARMRSNYSSSANQNQNAKNSLSLEEQARRRARAKKILGVAAGVTLAAALGYAAYKGSTNLRDKMREDIYRNMDPDSRNLHTMNSKYWNSDDRRKYAELTKERAEFLAKDLTRRDAAAAKFYEKTGIRVNLPQSRERVMAERVNANNYANFIRDAENRGSMNRKISDARKQLHRMETKARQADAARNHIQEEKYGDMWREQHKRNIQRQRELLNDLLAKRRAS